MAKPRQLDCNCGRDSRLPNPSLSHGHYHAVAVGGDFRNQLREGGRKVNGFMGQIKGIGATGACSS